ncbi:MAG: TIGR02453 family protein [Phycisphaerales bacterium]
MPPKQPHFTPALFKFLRGLAANNTREWFQANKDAFEEHVKGPVLRFIEDVGPRLAKLSPYIEAGPRSLHRMNRDTRFSKDKSPYKTAVTATFRHAKAGEMMLGYHLSLEAGKARAYFGLWEPETPVLEAVRGRILAQPAEWKKAVAPVAKGSHTFEGESLKRPPKVGGEAVAEDHPFVGDLKRKSFAASEAFSEKEACAGDFLDRYVESVKAGSPLMAFLCKAAGVPF